MPTFIESVTQFKENTSEALTGSKEGNLKELAACITFLSELMRTDNRLRGPRPDMRELLQSSDASVLFPKVVSDILIRPTEPLMVGQTLLARTIQADNVRSLQIPALGAMRAFDVPENAQYREQTPAFVDHQTEVKVGKVGLVVRITDEVIEDSMWDVVGLMLEQAGYALARFKEEKIFTAFTTYGHAVFDNDGVTPAGWTTGKAFDQTRNFSVTFDDMIDLMAALNAHGHVPTDLIVHPMAWAIFAKDPVIRNIAYHQGQMGATIWTQAPTFNQQANLPWAVNYQVTPFVPYTQSETLSTGPASGLGACDVTDIYAIDRNNALVILQRDQVGTEDFREPLRDVQAMKVRERYGVGVLNGGRSVAVLKNARITQNWAPHQTVLSVTPS